MIFLLRFWKPIAGALAVLCVILAIRGYGEHRYESGYAASEAKWQPRFDQAERELKAANEKAQKQEEDSKALVQESQRRIDETQKTLDARVADYDSRLRALSLRLAAASARSREVPQASGVAPSPDTAARINERAERAGASFADIGGRAERDAMRLSECVRIYTEQRAIINQ